MGRRQHNYNEQSIVTTTYSLSNEGSSNYLVDQVNTSNTDFNLRGKKVT